VGTLVVLRGICYTEPIIIIVTLHVSEVALFSVLSVCMCVCPWNNLHDPTTNSDCQGPLPWSHILSWWRTNDKIARFYRRTFSAKLELGSTAKFIAEIPADKIGRVTYKSRRFFVVR